MELKQQRMLKEPMLCVCLVVSLKQVVTETEAIQTQADVPGLGRPSKQFSIFPEWV